MYILNIPAEEGWKRENLSGAINGGCRGEASADDYTHVTERMAITYPYEDMKKTKDSWIRISSYQINGFCRLHINVALLPYPYTCAKVTLDVIHGVLCHVVRAIPGDL